MYQTNFNDGTEDDIGRQSGSYDLELEMDLGELIHPQGGSVYMIGEGSWTGDAGLDGAAVASLFGVNDDFGGKRTFDIIELWYEQAFFAGKLRLRVGKIELTGGFKCRDCSVSFDGNQFANDKTSQFLNGELSTIPRYRFPTTTLGL